MNKEQPLSKTERFDLQEYLLSVSRGRRGWFAAILRCLTGALAPVYRIGLEIYLAQYNVGLRRRIKLQRPVISIGNLTTGGTGKTPLTQMLVRLLTEAGIKVIVLSRGYAGKFEYGCAIASDGATIHLDALEAGDEAYLLAKTLPGVPVLVGKDRRITGKLGITQFSPDLVILDDGMQFWQLHRDLDIVLLNACEPFDNGWTFPRGLLREPPSHLRRAGIIVLTNVRRAGETMTSEVINTVKSLAPGIPVFTADFEPASLQPVGGGNARPSTWLAGKRVAALSGLGNPSSFEASLEQLGAVICQRFRFRDHHEITLNELDRVFAEATSLGATAVITTEKDAVKIALSDHSMPFYVLQVRMLVNELEAFQNVLWNKLESFRSLKS